MKRINEIFHSLQGEGRHTGTPAVFVRFSGCNLHCPFCDTDHAVGREMSDEEIIAEVRRHDVPLVVLTGGEPSLQLDAPFLKKLKEATGATIAIETNGTHPLPPGIDWVTLSPKTGIADRDLPIVLDRADEIKVVDTGQDLALPRTADTSRRHLPLPAAMPCSRRSAIARQHRRHRPPRPCQPPMAPLAADPPPPRYSLKQHSLFLKTKEATPKGAASIIKYSIYLFIE